MEKDIRILLPSGGAMERLSIANNSLYCIKKKSDRGIRRHAAFRQREETDAQPEQSRHSILSQDSTTDHGISNQSDESELDLSSESEREEETRGHTGQEQ